MNKQLMCIVSVLYIVTSISIGYAQLLPDTFTLGEVGICVDKPQYLPEDETHVTCMNSGPALVRGETVFFYLHLENIACRHRFRVKAYRDEVYQWVRESNWRYIRLAEPTTSLYLTTMSSLQAGNWRLAVFVDTGSGFQPLHTLFFHVAFWRSR